VITKEDIEQIIDNNGMIFVNDLTNKHIRDNYISIVNNLHNMGINNQKIKIKVYCKECGLEVIVRPSQYKKQKQFLCDTHIKHRHSGKDSPFYNRIDVNCTNCNRPYSVIPYDYNKTNRFGDSHNFCCQKCYWEYRSRYYVNEKHSMFGTHQSDENKSNQRDLALRMIANGELPQTMTKPHKKINDLLLSNNIKVENEHLEKYHSVDVYLPEYNLMIEIMGDYWHAHPTKYDANNLTKQQKKSIKQDRSKHSYVKKYKNVEILYLWEQDIKKNIDLCWLLIQSYINNCGILGNYHSFNYSCHDGELKLNDIIVTPIQDNKSKEDLNIAI
jgi:G:T-mismatch repair DNA endonuclease (very short patch repair protein)